MKRHTRSVTALAGTWLLLAACGLPGVDPASTTTTTERTAATSTTISNLGGDRLPVQIDGETYAHHASPITGSLSLEANGCWTADLGDGPRIVIFPTGYAKPIDQPEFMVSPDGTRFGDGMEFDGFGGIVMITSLPGGPDGFWGNYVGFCDPERGEAVVIDTLQPAFDPDQLTEDELVEMIETASFTESWDCGFGFQVSTFDQRIAIRIHPTDMESVPAPPAIPDPMWSAHVVIGKNLQVNNCDDAVEGWEPAPLITVVWPIIAGALEFTVPDHSGCDTGSAVEAALTGAVVETPIGDRDLGDLTMLNAAYGCFAG